MVADLCSEQPQRSPWWLFALIEELPQGSAFVADRLGGREWRDWTTDRFLLAGIFDALQVNTVATVRVAGGKVKPPKPVPRPGDKPKASGGVPLTSLMPSKTRAASVGVMPRRLRERLGED